MKLQLFTATLATLAIQASFATASSIPTCPTVDDLKRVGVSLVSDPSPEKFNMAFEKKNTFNTQDEWTLVVGVFSGNFKSVILGKANQGISDLIADTKYQDGSSWVCTYKSMNDPYLMEMTVTPATDKLDHVSRKVMALHSRS